MRFRALIISAALATTASLASSAGAVPASPQQRLAHISVTSIGKGSPVVLIPGLSSPRAVWDGIAPDLAAHHRVILVQINGFGGDAPGANLDPGVIGGVMADLHSYLAANHLTGVKVIGHSLGGTIALDFAKADPGDVSAVMIVDALPYVGDIFVPGATVAQVEPQAKMMRDQMIASFGKPNPAADKMAATMALTPGAQAKVAAWIGQADPRVAGEAMYEDLTTDLRPDMAAIATPITLLYPTTDATSKEKTDFYRAEYAKAPNVTYVPIANSGHFIMLDQPQAFAQAVRAFAD